jgi:hypothetical protein
MIMITVSIVLVSLVLLVLRSPVLSVNSGRGHFCSLLPAPGAGNPVSNQHPPTVHLGKGLHLWAWSGARCLH